MKKYYRLALFAALISFFGFANAQNVAVINGHPIKKELLDFVIKSQGLEDTIKRTPSLREKISKELIKRTVLEQEAIRLGLDKTKDAKNTLALAKQSILVGELIKNFQKKHPVTDAQYKKAYEEYKKNVGSEYKSRHILVKTKKEADKILTKLKGKNGAKKFAALAKKHSLDKASAVKGGELGWSSVANYVPAFGNALKALKKGETTKAAVKTRFGYHIIKLEDVRKVKPDSLAKMKPRLKNQIMRKSIEDYEKVLRSKAKVE